MDSARVVASNLASLVAGNTASGAAPETPAVLPAAQSPQQKRRRWPWQQKPQAKQPLAVCATIYSVWCLMMLQRFYLDQRRASTQPPMV